MSSGSDAARKGTLRLLVTLLALSSVPGTPSVGQVEEESVRYEASHDSMGTVFTVVAYGRDAKFLAQVANEVFEEIDRLDAQMSNYKAESELSAINRNATREPVLVEPHLFDLISDSIRYSQETSGAFDITVGPLLKSWGFFRGEGRVPPPAELAQVMARVGYRHIRRDHDRRAIRFDVGGLELDLGGLAKGYAVDRGVNVLRSYGVGSALVSAGTSSIYALGAPPCEPSWRISLRDPYEKGKVGDVVRLRNYSLSVSGSYEKFFKLDGTTYSHIIDPRNGKPVQGMLAAAVLGPQAVETDALSTALFVLGEQGSRPYLSHHPNLAVLFYQAASAAHSFKRVHLRSATFTPPPKSVAEFVK